MILALTIFAVVCAFAAGFILGNLNGYMNCKIEKKWEHRFCDDSPVYPNARFFIIGPEPHSDDDEIRIAVEAELLSGKDKTPFIEAVIDYDTFSTHSNPLPEEE